MKALPVAALLVTVLAGCGDDGGGPGDAGPMGDGDIPRRDAGPLPDAEPVPVAPGDYTYTLEESTADLPLWTTPVMRKIETRDRPPEERRSGLSMSAARREFEPVHLVLGPANGSVTVDVAPFDGLGASQRIELAVASYESGFEEHLTPLSSGGSVDLDPGQGTPLWITVRVPDDAPAGDHETTITLTPSSGSPVTVPLRLYVFDFEIPQEIHFATQLNIDVSSLVGSGSVDDAKTLLFEHRFTPKSVTWPSGFNWNITWDSDANPARCMSFYDEPDEGPMYSIRHLARRYILGEGWNGVGFPNAMIFQFVDNSTPRPDTFCGVSRGDHMGTDAYNREWSAFLSALDGYLVDNSYAERAYYYVQNEPQDAADEALAAHLCRLTRAAAPDLRIAVSEEPKPSIAEDPGGACGYDIWIAHVRAYEEGYAWQRQRDHGEQVWFYSLDHDPDPYFNPTTVDRQGMHQRIIPWAAWSHRIRGWAYYDFTRFFDGPQPGVRAELFREGFEDYEYLWLANGGAYPEVYVDSIPEVTVRSVASSMTSWTKDADAFMAVRHELGRFIEGSRSTLPVLTVESGRPRGEYHINFQDPAGRPAADPLVVGGSTYMKVGWEAWDDAAGYGWSGENIGTDIVMYGFDDVAGYSPVQKSYVYDDYGRDNLFEFELEPGRYEVTVGVGRPARGYPGDPHNVTLEGTVLVDDEVTTDAEPTITRTATIDLADGRLSLVMGGRSASTGDYAYTFLEFMDIVPVP